MSPTRTSAPWSTAPEPFVHPALFYRGPQAYLAGTVPFIRAGLAAGEPVAVAVPKANLRLLQDELGPTAEQVQMLDMTVVGRNPGRIIPGVLRAFADAHPQQRVRIIGEPIWPQRSALEYPACLQHEALINLAFAGRQVTILCPYDTAGLAPSVLADAATTHPVVIDERGEHASEHYAASRAIEDGNQPLPDPPDGWPTAELTLDAPTPGPARMLAVQQATLAGLDFDRSLDVELVVYELATNALMHGDGSGTLRIWTQDRYLVCEVANRGHISDPLAGRRPASPDARSGRGLLLVNQLADLVRLHTRPGATTLRAYFAL